MRILIVGDVHGDFSALLALLRREQPDLVLQVGDFGIWPTALDSLQKFWPMDLAPIYFCEGNHEYYPAIQEQWARFGLKRDAIPFAGQIFWMPRGSTLALPDGRVVCFLGGAHSVDHPLRQKGRNWFEDEILGPEVLDHLPERADIVISHTAPRSLGIAAELSKGRSVEDWRKVGWDVTPDPSEDILDEVLHRLRPSLWYFGHFHRPYLYHSKGCQLIGLSALDDEGSWTWLPQSAEDLRREFEHKRRQDAKELDQIRTWALEDRETLQRRLKAQEDPWPWLKTFHQDDLAALAEVLEKGSRELELVRRVMASREGGTTMLNKHHVDYLEPGTADVWDERDLPPGPFHRRKLILYYTQGAWIWARAEESSPALLLAHYDTWQPGYVHRMGGPTDALDVALEICAQIDGVSYEDRHKLIEAQVEALAAARLEAEHQQTDPDV